MRWIVLSSHNDASGELQKSFCTNRDYQKHSSSSMYGEHSFEFDRGTEWEQMESFCRKISDMSNVWYTTNKIM